MFLLGMVGSFAIFLPLTMMKSWKRKVAYMWLMWLITFPMVEVNFSNQYHLLNSGVVTICMVMLSIYFYTYDKHTTDYLYMLEDKLKEEVSWKHLLTNLPESITCFNNDFECTYQNFLTMELFTTNKNIQDSRGLHTLDMLRIKSYSLYCGK